MITALGYGTGITAVGSRHWDHGGGITAVGCGLGADHFDVNKLRGVVSRFPRFWCEG